MTVRKRPRQFSISLKVTGEQKAAFEQIARERGCKQSELLFEAVAGAIKPSQPLIDQARQHLRAVHRVLAADGIDRADVEQLVSATLEFIALVRQAR